VLRRIFGSKRDEVIGGWTKLHNEKLHNWHYSADVIRVIRTRIMRWAENAACMRENANRALLVGRPEGKRTLGRP
jgi:hypothetical protein